MALTQLGLECRERFTCPRVVVDYRLRERRGVIVGDIDKHLFLLFDSLLILEYGTASWFLRRWSLGVGYDPYVYVAQFDLREASF